MGAYDHAAAGRRVNVVIENAGGAPGHPGAGGGLGTGGAGSVTRAGRLGMEGREGAAYSPLCCRVRPCPNASGFRQLRGRASIP